ncbi:MAG: dicarboxylate/amino acid:cation symporter [Rikenellaceae bacterium]
MKGITIKRRPPLYASILLGMFLGVVAGILAYNLDSSTLVTNWIAPFGEIFMRLLKAIAIPLVFLSLVKGVANMGNMSSLSRLGGRTILIYLSTTIIAILLGLVLVLSIEPGRVVDAENSQNIQQLYSTSVEQHVTSAHTISESSPLQGLVDIFPENVISALGNNNSMLQVIVIALLIGIATLMLSKEKTEPFLNFVDSLDAITMKIIDLIMQFAPFGVFALMANMVVGNASNMQLLGALGLYFATVVFGLFLLILGFYPLLVKLFTKTPVDKFYKKMFPIQLLAFTTSSSAAVLPLNLENIQQQLGVSNRTASFVLPVGVTINMDGTSLYQTIGAVFIAQVMGIDLSFVQILTILATTTISSIGTPGVPGGSVVILVMVLGSVGIPAEGLALILGIDRPLDMLRTVVNVTGDSAVAMIVDKTTKKETKN